MKRPKHGQLLLSGGYSSNFSKYEVDARKLSHKDLSEILQDGYINSLWNKRRGGVINVKWEITPSSDKAQDKMVADFIADILHSLHFDRICYKMLSAIWYGYAFAQVIWQNTHNRFIPSDIKVHDISKFKWDSFKKTWVMGENQLPIPEGRFWLFTAMSENDDVPYGRGLGLDVHLAWYLRKYGWKYWTEYLQKFGSPSLKGIMPESIEDKEKELEAFENALDNFHSLGWMVLPYGFQADVVDAGAKGWKSNYEIFLEKWDTLLPQIILGQTMTTQDGSSRSQASVHKDVQDEIIQKDADLLCESFNNTVVKWICAFNFPSVVPPKIKRKILQKEDLSARASREQVIAQMTGLRPTKKYIQDTYGGEWEQAPQPLVNSPAFAETRTTGTSNRKDNEDAITPIYEDMVGTFENSDPYADFAEDILKKYNSLEDLQNDWAAIERQLLGDPKVLKFARKLKEALAVSSLNGALKADKDLTEYSNG